MNISEIDNLNSSEIYKLYDDVLDNDKTSVIGLEFETCHNGDRVAIDNWKRVGSHYANFYIYNETRRISIYSPNEYDNDICACQAFGTYGYVNLIGQYIGPCWERTAFAMCRNVPKYYNMCSDYTSCSGVYYCS